jgi:TPR repeat protein
VKLTPPAKPLKLSSEPERTLEQKLAEAALKFQADLKSAEIGDSEAQLRVGMQLYQGQGVLQDRKKGFSWILEAAEDGKYSPESLHILGQAYFKGTDTEKNYVAARKWLGLLADQDNFSAKNDFAYLLYHGLGGDTDYAKAFELYKQAAIHGDVLAQANLGLMYATGTGTEVDKARAYAWYSFAARQGNGAAAKNQNDLLKDMSWEELNAAQRISIELYREVERRNPKP